MMEGIQEKAGRNEEIRRKEGVKEGRKERNKEGDTIVYQLKTQAFRDHGLGRRPRVGQENDWNCVAIGVETGASKQKLRGG
jgi:hypothetical protein